MTEIVSESSYGTASVRTRCVSFLGNLWSQTSGLVGHDPTRVSYPRTSGLFHPWSPGAIMWVLRS